MRTPGGPAALDADREVHVAYFDAEGAGDLGLTALPPLTAWPSEKVVTEALFNVPGLLDPASAGLVFQAMLAGVPASRRERVLRSRALWTWLPRASPGPDLGLVDAWGNVVAVIEHKRGASANCTSWDRIRDRMPFDDPLARSLVIPPYTRGPHRRDECEGCEGQFHTALRNPRGWSAGVHQIDFYRWSGQGWVRPVSTGEPVHLADPRDVLWVVLDRDNRPADQIFDGAVTAAHWDTTGYAQLVPALEAALAHALDNDNPAEGITALRQLIQMVTHARP